MIEVDFAIITIRSDEFAAVLERFPAKAQKGSSGRTYGISQTRTKNGDNCVVALVRSSEQGNDAARYIINDILYDMNPQMLLVVGIAGGVPDDEFTLGDVIVSSRIDNFTVSKREVDGTENFNIVSGIDPITSDIAASLYLYQEQLAGWNDSTSITLSRPSVDLSQFDTDTFKNKITANTDKDIADWYKDLQSSIKSHFASTRLPLFETGRIASINSVIRNVDLLVQWLQNARTIRAVEMESAGIYQATQQVRQQYPVMAIRGISDIIGLERENQWTKYACQTAAAFTYAFVTAGIVTPRATSTVSATPTVSAASTVGSTPTARQNTTPSWENIQGKLRYRLGVLFPQEWSIRTLVRDVDSTLEALVVWNGNAVYYWSEILRQVRIRHLELNLIEAALMEYPQDEVLQQARYDIKMLHLGASTTAIITPTSASSPATQSNKPTDSTKPINIFISYAEEDEKFKKQLETHLSLLRRERLINPWHSNQATIGVLGRDQEIIEQIDSAQIILILMSPSFIASDQLYENELTRAIDRQKAGDPVRVIQITVRPVALGDPDNAPDYQKIQGLPRNGKPIDSWRNPDEAWALIAQEIRQVCRDLRENYGKI